MSLITNLKKRGLKDILRPTKWKIYLRYLAAKFRMWIIGDPQMKAWRKEYSELSNPVYLEQIVYRMMQEGCRPCMLKGECVHCGCKSPELFFDKDNSCSGMNWFEMQPPHLWEEFKQMNGIEIPESYIEQVKKQGKITQWLS